jgi:hypothetical protein
MIKPRSNVIFDDFMNYKILNLKDFIIKIINIMRIFFWRIKLIFLRHKYYCFFIPMIVKNFLNKICFVFRKTYKTI